jgi:polyferredoxin
MCPIGTLSELLARLGRRLFRKNFVLWRWLDYPLRALKYLLLLFFVYAFAAMGEQALGLFIDGGYNRVADLKMYLFFAHITPLALTVFAVLALASVLVEKFWCRYLCPYGALLGLAGFAAPWRVTRVKASCIDCELCTRACPSHIVVHRVGQRRQSADVGQVWSDECTSCMQCIEACPVKDTLVLRTRRRAPAVPAWVIGALIVGVFGAVTGLGMLTGHWQNGLSMAEYLAHFGQLARTLAPTSQ